MATVMFQLEVEGLVATYSLMGLLIAQAGYPTEVGRNKSDIMEGGKWQKEQFTNIYNI